MLLHLLKLVALPAIAVIVFGVGIFLIRRSARRFEAQQLATGEWDENGPKHPTKPKPWEVVDGFSSLNFRLGNDDTADSNAPDDLGTWAPIVRDDDTSG